MAKAQQFPEDYENGPVRAALEELAAAPSLAGLDTLLAAATSGGLAVDLTGSTEESGPRVRTVASTDGGLVLPLFTSLAEIRKAVAVSGGEGTPVQAAILPAREALTLIGTADFVAVQFNPGSHAQVVARTHIDSTLAR